MARLRGETAVAEALATLEASGESQLNLTGFELDELPEEIRAYRQLTHLVLRNNRLTRLPAWIGELRELTQLSLADNPLDSLPAEIGLCRRLTHLNARNCALSSLPLELVELEELSMLRLTGNRLDIPDDILAKWDRPQEIIGYYISHLPEPEPEPIPPPTLQELLAQAFNAEQFARFCDTLTIPPEFLQGETQAAQSAALIAYHRERGLEADFRALVELYAV